jgi:serine/threonine protein kinase
LDEFLQLVEDVWSSLPSELPEGSADSGPPRGRPASRPGAKAIGRFEVGQELGRGGFGVVVKAFDPSLDRTVALKVPGPATLASLDSRGRFIGEAKAVAALRHPNIVTIHEAGEADAVPYIAMEYCELGSLADWLASRGPDRPAPIRWAADLVARLASGLQHAHDQGILHRDLKPSNILLQPAPDRSAPRARKADDPAQGADAPDFVPKIADFGLAKRLDAYGDGPDADRTRPGFPLGTLPFMAPEAARGDGPSIGPQADVYGLGVILFMVLTGRRPFAATTREELVHQILHVAPRSPRILRPGLPPDLATICLKCLEKDPDNRYPTPRALGDDLRRFLIGRPILARPTPSWKRAVSWVRLHPVPSAMVGLFSLALVGGLAGRSYLRALEQRGEIRVNLRQLEATNVAGLPELVPQLDPTDPDVSKALDALFSGGNPTQRLASALVLAKVSPEHGDYTFDRLLQAKPADILPIARVLAGRMPDLTARLAAQVESVPHRGSAEALAAHRRRANAACALVGLGEADRAWPLLRFTPDPQSRSYLIQLLGPAGIDPATVADRLEVEADPTIRRALIQSLGEFPDSAWTEPLRARVRSKVLALYEHDPDPGVHGSSKWLLLRWGLDDRLRTIDGKIAAGFRDPTSRPWRVDPVGLTFVRIDQDEQGRVLEVSDTEVTIGLFREIEERRWPVVDDRLPASLVSYYQAAAFCNWLSEKSGIPKDQWCYGPRPKSRSLLVAVEDYRDRIGYRLLEAEEFLRVSQSGATTRFAFGDAADILGHYAWHMENSGGAAQRPALLKPNEFGLFDTLGNLQEWVEMLPWEPIPSNLELLGFAFPTPRMTFDPMNHPPRKSNAVTPGLVTDGFRVARTVRLNREGTTAQPIGDR